MTGSFLKNGSLCFMAYCNIFPIWAFWRVSQISTLLCPNWYLVVWSDWMLLLCWQWFYTSWRKKERKKERKTGKQEDGRVTAGGMHMHVKMVQNLPVVTGELRAAVRGPWVLQSAEFTMMMMMMMMVVDRWRQGRREVALFPPRQVG